MFLNFYIHLYNSITCWRSDRSLLERERSRQRHHLVGPCLSQDERVVALIQDQDQGPDHHLRANGGSEADRDDRDRGRTDLGPRGARAAVAQAAGASRSRDEGHLNGGQHPGHVLRDLRA